MKRIFILEDDPTRMQQLRGWIANELREDEYAITHYESAVGARAHESFDLYLLDHDLGGRQLEENEDCGLMFCKEQKEKISPIARVIFHSYNYGGAANMRHELGHGTIAPFGGRLFREKLKEYLYEA